MRRLSRDQQRALGLSFSNGHYRPLLPVDSTAIQPAPRRRRREYVGQGSDIRGFLFFLVTHALFDSIPEASFPDVATNVAQHLEIDRSVSIDTLAWIRGKYHCRYHPKRSDATQVVETYLARLPSLKQKQLLTLLVVSALWVIRRRTGKESA